MKNNSKYLIVILLFLLVLSFFIDRIFYIYFLQEILLMICLVITVFFSIFRNPSIDRKLYIFPLIGILLGYISIIKSGILTSNVSIFLLSLILVVFIFPFLIKKKDDVSD